MTDRSRNDAGPLNGPMVAAAALVIMAASARGGAQSIAAVRVDDPPRVDGRLTEPIWRSAPAITELTQQEPSEGAPAIERTEVRFAYDDDALYVGARMFSDNPRDIRALVTRRDNRGISEMFGVSFDTYRDRRTAYSFAVTAAGVRLDLYHPSDDDDGDSEYDPVWEARTEIDSLGWTAEMRIPFTQLRFSPREVQEWGLQVVRFVPARNEESYWALIRRTETGWASRMGTLTGIRGIRPSRRVELLPYVAANTRIAAVEDPGDPFQREYDNAARAGADLKAGLGPNLTLDVTLNPDFGQVEADPAVVNLSAYEIFFDERRPFFQEGADLFGDRGFFYSRRIGAPPPGGTSADYAERLSNTTILGAAKLTGRLASGLSVAALAAVTDREEARTFDTGTQQFGRTVVAPRTAYAVASARQEFGEEASTFGGMLTMVQRDLEDGSPLADLLARSAYSGQVDGRLRWAQGKYDVSAFAGFTQVRGDSGAILRQQLSSRRFFQRPDAGHVGVDPSRRTLSGTRLGFNHSKMAGAHWLWDIDTWQESPGLEPNDIGAFGAVDNRGLFARLRWRETEPSSWYRRYEVGVGTENNWNFEWLRRRTENFAFFNTTFSNFWDLRADFTYQPRGLSDRLTRGGPVMATPRAAGTSLELENSDNARTGWGVEASYGRDENGGWEGQVELNLSFRPGDRWELRFDPEWSQGTDTRQFVTTEANGRPETFGTRYVFGHVDLSEISARFRLNYTFTPNLTLETYAQPFAASGRFHGFGETLAPSSNDLLVYGTGGTTIVRNADGSHTVTADGQSFDIDNEDFNERSLRTNVVLRWEWRLGSTMYLVWQQNRGAERPFARARPVDLFDALKTRGDNFLSVKVSYWVPVR